MNVKFLFHLNFKANVYNGLYSIIIILLILVPLFVLTYRLSYNPPGFFIDEAIYGYEAYSLITTKGHSSSGEFLPRLFLNPGETIRNHSAFTYFTIPLIYLFGISEFSVRLTSVLFSLGLLFLILLLLRTKVTIFSLCLIVLFWPFIPWVFLLSRIGMEFIGTAFFFTLTTYILSRMYNMKDFSIYSYILLIFSIGNLFYIYAAGKILALGLMIFSILLLISKKINIYRILTLTGLFISSLALSIPYVIDGSFFYRVDELKQCRVNKIYCFGSNLLSHVSPNSYFKKTYLPPDFSVPTHSITDTPLIPLFFAPFLIIGLIIILKNAFKKNFFSLLIVYCTILAMIPASLTIRGFDSYRSVGLLPIIIIISLLGFDACLRWIRLFNIKLVFIFVIFSFSIASIEIYSLFNKITAYEQLTHVASYSGWQYGYRAIFTYFTDHYTEYDHFLVTDKVAYLPKLYLRFFDPGGSCPKIKIGSTEYQNSKRTLYAIRPEELSWDNFKIKHTIYYPNENDAAFYLGVFY